jgi:rhodanese-related sulfurtransferase
MKKRMFLVPVAACALVLGVSSCGGGTPATSVAPVASDVASAVIIDVRTAEEFAAGHVTGALNLDFTSGEFEAALADLDKESAYTVYCRSGNRSAQAAALMASAGFTRVNDLGSLEDAAAALALPVTSN